MARLDCYWIIGLTILFEAITCLFRFGLGLESTHDTQELGRFTFGLRIHHGYIGGIMVMVAFLFSSDRFLHRWLLRVGGALIASDLAHHFLVLWPVTGDPHFDLAYPSK